MEIFEQNVWGANCAIIEESDYLYVIPKTMDDYRKILTHTHDTNFIFTYKSSLFFDCIALVDYIENEIDKFKLILKILARNISKNTFTALEIKGEVIDNFFSPVRYFVGRSKDEIGSINYLYDSEIVDEWESDFENKKVKIILSYGGILSEGIKSDLKLHPKLRVVFEETDDIQFIFRLYYKIVDFLKIIRYDKNYGNLKVVLITLDDERISYNGYLNDYNQKNNVFFLLFLM